MVSLSGLIFAGLDALHPKIDPLLKTKLLAPTGILLILAIGNFIRLNANSQIRMVDFLAIFSIGALATFFIIQIILFLNAKKNSNA